MSEMFSSAPGETGNHVTGSKYEQVRGLSSMPAKKRLVVEYREMAPRDTDSQPPTCVTGNGQVEDPLPTGGHSSSDNDRRVGDRYHSARIGGADGLVGTECVPSVSAADDRGEQKCDMDDIQANKEKVLGLIDGILASGESNADKERKLGDIIADLETVRRRLVAQKAAQLKVSPVSLNVYTVS